MKGVWRWRQVLVALWVWMWAAPALAQQPAGEEAEAAGEAAAEAVVEQAGGEGGGEAEAASLEETLLREATAESGESSAAAEPPDIGYTATVMFFGAGLLALSAWGVRRYYTGRGYQRAHMVDVLDTVRLDGGDRISLVEVEGRRVLVGRSNGRMAALDAWPVRSAQGGGERVSEEREALEEDLASASRRFHRRLTEASRGEGRVESQGHRVDPDPPPRQDGSGERESILASLRQLEGKRGHG